jgi:hypothetical protein
MTKYSVRYYQCSRCKFIQTENPYWLNEAYNRTISSMDVGLVYRNVSLAKAIDPILKSFFNYKGRFLDFAGGYGLFVRLMRDQGFDFYRQDIYCENLFACYLDLEDLPENSSFEALTAFEVFEHLVNPFDEIRRMFQFSENIIFSTELQPDKPLISSQDWWYFVPESGQHISFYTMESLAIIAEKFNCDLYSNNINLHIFTKRKLNADPFKFKGTTANKSLIYKALNKLFLILNKKRHLLKRIELESLLHHDFEMAKKNSLRKNIS